MLFLAGVIAGTILALLSILLSVRIGITVSGMVMHRLLGHGNEGGDGQLMADVFTAIGRQSHSGQFTIAQRVALRALLAEEFALPYQEVRVAARRDPRS